MILASCVASELTEAGRMWLVPAGGGKATALTPPRPDGPDLSDSSLWQLHSGRYLQAQSPVCGSATIARQGTGRKVQIYKVPGAGDIGVVTATASRLLSYAARAAQRSRSHWHGSTRPPAPRLSPSPSAAQTPASWP